VVVVGVMVILRVLVDAQLTAQAIQVRSAAVVLQPASNLDLLGLGSAAPHWLDPLDGRGPVVSAPLTLAYASATERDVTPPIGYGTTRPVFAPSSVLRLHGGGWSRAYPPIPVAAPAASSRGRSPACGDPRGSRIVRRRPFSDTRRSASRSAAT